VDDNADAAESLALFLKLEGHETRIAHDGPAALEAASTYRPEVVLLDIGLPGLNGYEVAKLLRRQAGLDGALLLALTGYGEKEDRRRSEEAGINFHLVKPFEPEQLQRLLASWNPPAGVS
jgi:CheY-like chemotaxis protein